MSSSFESHIIIAERECYRISAERSLRLIARLCLRAVCRLRSVVRKVVCCRRQGVHYIFNLTTVTVLAKLEPRLYYKDTACSTAGLIVGLTKVSLPEVEL